MAESRAVVRAGAISAKHALNGDEVRFCQMYLAIGENGTEAYRRTFLIYESDVKQWFDLDAKGQRTGGPIKAREIGKRASALLRKDYIQRYLDELRQSTGDAARSALAEHVRFGEPTEALRAASRILDDEDKLGFRDAVEEWAEIMCDVGAEVVVPLPGRVESDVLCPHCFEEHHVSLPIEVSVPMANMFPSLGEDGEGAAN
ncbi:MAG: hypothetical protein ACYSW8_26500 [Planctomycetota bacterium]|jgi:hypothetical protein